MEKVKNPKLSLIPFAEKFDENSLTLSLPSLLGLLPPILNNMLVLRCQKREVNIPVHCCQKELRMNSRTAERLEHMLNIMAHFLLSSVVRDSYRFLWNYHGYMNDHS